MSSYSQQQQQQPHYQPHSSNRMKSNLSLTSNLDLYIHSVCLKTTEAQVISLFFQSGIGIVDWCKVVITNDLMYASVFIRLESWSPNSGACEDFERNQSIHLHLSRERSEFWTIERNQSMHLSLATSLSAKKMVQMSEKMDTLELRLNEMYQLLVLQQEKMDVLQKQAGVGKEDKKTDTMGERYPELFTKIDRSLEDNIEYSVQGEYPPEKNVEYLYETRLTRCGSYFKPSEEPLSPVIPLEEEDYEPVQLKLPIFPRSTAIFNFKFAEDEC